MQATYRHTNIIARDWRALSSFYKDVFGCTVATAERDYAGDWLATGTGVPNATLQGVHLRLPGWGEAGPTLEIFSYGDTLEDPRNAKANKQGFAHIAFEVDDVAAFHQRILDHGGQSIGEVVEKKLGETTLIFVYVGDPEGNIIELQHFRRAD